MLEALLQSPHFLYMVEPAAAGRRGAPVSIPPFALASRLSYYLWNSTPDEALLAAAEANQLRTREQIAAQTARMMADRRFRDTVASFHLQWLDLTELDGVEKRNRIYPLFTPDMRASMREETVRFADHVVRQGDGLLDTLLNGALHLRRQPAARAVRPAQGATAPGRSRPGNRRGDGWSRVELAGAAARRACSPRPA